MLLDLTPSRISKADINNFTAFLIICANPIAWVGKGGVLPIICILCLLLLFFVNRRFTIPTFALALFSVIFFLISFSLKENFDNSYFQNYYTTFFSLGLTAFLCGQMPICENKLIKLIGIFSFVYFPFILTIDMGNVEVDSIDYGKWMGISYGILRLLNSLIIIAIFSNIKLLRLMGIFGALAYLSFLVVYGSRGTLVSIFILVFFLFIIKNDYTKKTVLKISCLCILPLSLTIIYFKDILFFLDNISSKFGIHIFFVEKMIRLIESGNSLSSGRDTLTNQALEGIMQSPFIGNGIATFEPYNSGYVHNIFLQVFYELGIIPFILLICLLGYSINYILTNSHSKERRIFMTFLISAGVIELLFSSSLWLSQIFWFFTGYTIRIILLKKRC